jgi:hypothetical protein
VDWVFLAMVRYRQEHPDEARQHLRKAIRLFEQATQEKPGKQTGGSKPRSWNERLHFQLLRREAETPLQGKNP